MALFLELGQGTQQRIALHLVSRLSLLQGQRFNPIGLDLLQVGIDQQHLVVLPLNLGRGGANCQAGGYASCNEHGFDIYRKTY